MRMLARPAVLLLSIAALLLLPGCPTVTLGHVAIKAGSVSTTGFTLTTTIVVEEVDATDGESTPQEGRGLLGVLLPVGWVVTDARLTSPMETSVRKLVAVPQAALVFGETFPAEPGQWWAFGSNTQTIPQGRYEYLAEITVQVPKKTKGGLIGLSAGVWTDALDELGSPVKYEVGLKGKKGTLTATAGAAAGAAAPLVAPVEEAPPGKGGNDKTSGG